MSAADATRIAALAARLELSPRQVLALAARVAASAERPLDARGLATEIGRLRDAREAAAAATDLLLLGHASFALDDIDHALRLVWSEPRRPGP